MILMVQVFRNVCISHFYGIIRLIYISLSGELAASKGTVFPMVGRIAPCGI